MGVQEIWDQGVSKVKGAVSESGIEHQAFAKGFVRMCTDGYSLGWHERNGGNASYRLTPEDVIAARGYFMAQPRDWVPLGVRAASLAGEYFMVTGTGKYMRNVADDLALNVGIVEIDSTGSAYRVVWGLRDGGGPTSEFVGHFIMHATRKNASKGQDRVIYHCHPTALVALTKVCKLEPQEITRLLWKQMTECIIIFPEGVGVVPCLVPGSLDLARSVADQMSIYHAVFCAQHGIFGAGKGFDDAFGLIHVIVKAAEMYRDACVMASAAGCQAGEGGAFLNEVSDEDLRAIVDFYHLNAPFLQ